MAGLSEVGPASPQTVGPGGISFLSLSISLLSCEMALMPLPHSPEDSQEEEEQSDLTTL